MKTSQCSCGAPKDKRAALCRSCKDKPLLKKQCRRCGEQKPISEFRIRTRITPRPRSKCKKCEAAEQSIRLKKKPLPERISKLREWEAANPEKVWIAKLKHRIKHLGLMQEMSAILEVVANQKTCKICGNLPNDRYKHLHIDHNHTTGRFRGLLCDRCNLSIGKFEDDPILLRCAADYLEK